MAVKHLSELDQLLMVELAGVSTVEETVEVLVGFMGDGRRLRIERLLPHSQPDSIVLFPDRSIKLAARGVSRCFSPIDVSRILRARQADLLEGLVHDVLDNTRTRYQGRKNGRTIIVKLEEE